MNTMASLVVVEDKDFSRDVATVPTMSAVAAPSRSFLSQTRRYYHARSSSGSHSFSPTLYQLFLFTRHSLLKISIERKFPRHRVSLWYRFCYKIRDPKLIRNTPLTTREDILSKGAQNKRVDGKRNITKFMDDDGNGVYSVICINLRDAWILYRHVSIKF